MYLREALENVRKLRESVDLEIKQNRNDKNKTEEEKANFKPSTDPHTINLMEQMILNLGGNYSKGRASIKESLTTTDAVKLIPKIIEGKLLEASEPAYLGTNFFQTIHVDGGNSAVYVIPVVGELYAHEVGEGQRYKEETFDMNTIENAEIEVRVKKVGVKVSITEEAIADSSWDILGINVRKMGKAMARYKEEQIFNTFSDGCHTVFDNNLRSQDPSLGTTGRDKNGEFNDTLSVEDFLDATMALMAKGYNPSDAIFHPLTWVIFARNSMLGNGLTFGALGGNNVSPWGTIQGTNAPFGLQNNGNGQKLIMRPEDVQNRLPVPMNINFSPFVKFNKENKTFDMYIIDRSEVGVIVEREGLSTDNWSDPEKDIRMLKAKERYGIGLLNNGQAINVVKGIAVAPSYPLAPEVRVKTE